LNPAVKIAEGYGRKTTPDYIRSLYVAYGSNCDLETDILLSGDLGDIKSVQLKGIQKDLAEVERMLKALIKSLENKHLNPFLQLNGRRTIYVNACERSNENAGVYELFCRGNADAHE
jgi:hypothetical protein